MFLFYFSVSFRVAKDFNEQNRLSIKKEKDDIYTKNENTQSVSPTLVSLMSLYGEKLIETLHLQPFEVKL